VKFSKHKRHIVYSVTKRIPFQNVKCTLCKGYKRMYVLWCCTLCDVHVLTLLCFVCLRCVQYTLCSDTLKVYYCYSNFCIDLFLQLTYEGRFCCGLCLNRIEFFVTKMCSTLWLFLRRTCSKNAWSFDQGQLKPSHAEVERTKIPCLLDLVDYLKPE
jgi:hypothetical protein